MGAIHFRRVQLVTSLNELVGYKAGVALTRDQMKGFLPPDRADLLAGDDETMLRVRSEVFDELLCKLLFAVGNIRSDSIMPSIIRLYHRVKNDDQLLSIYQKLGEQIPVFVEKATNEALAKGIKTIGPAPFVEWAQKQCGPLGAAMAIEMMLGFNEDMHKSSLSAFRSIEWQDIAELKALFKSEDLETPHGEFFDQRFVDYLSHNFQSIDEINWRKFEGLTCEFFHRLGLEVEIGKGRNDESVDARVWEKGKSTRKPPLILVQCKRQKEKVEKVVVKALYADVMHEKAKLGLVVTSSALSPGARKVCLARSYPVTESNRDTLKEWVSLMRTPYSGIFLGE